MHFSVNVEDGAEVFSGALDRHATDWRDEVVDLPASDVSRILVFATHADLPSIDGATPLQTAPACWGSVALLGRSEISKPAPPNVILVSLDTLRQSLSDLTTLIIPTNQRPFNLMAPGTAAFEESIPRPARLQEGQVQKEELDADEPALAERGD